MSDMKDCFVKTTAPSPWEMRKAEPYVGEDGIYMPIHEYIYEGTATEYRMVISKELFQEAFKEYIQKEGLLDVQSKE